MKAENGTKEKIQLTTRALGFQLAALIAVVSLADFVFGAVNVVHMTSVGLNPGTIGTVLAVAGFISTLVEAPSGALGDIFGQRRLLVIGLVMWGLGQIAFGLSNSPWIIGIALVLWAIGMACYSGAPYALVVNALKIAGREDLIANTIRRTQVTRWVASAIGALAVYLFVSKLNTGLVIAGAGLLILVLAPLIRFTWAESPRSENRRVRDVLREGLALTCTGQYRAIAAVTALGSAMFAVVVFAWQPIAVEAGLDTPTLGILLIVFTAASALGAASTRIVKNRYFSSSIFAVLLVSTLLAFMWTGAWTSLVLLLMCQFVLGFLMAINGMWSHEVFPDRLRNTMVSIMGVIGGVAMAAIDFSFGFLWSAAGAMKASAMLGCILVVISILTGLFLRAKRKVSLG